MTKSEPLRVFIGYDHREHDAYLVALHSLLRHTQHPLDVTPLNVRELRRAGLYRRATIPGTWVDDQELRPMSTEFAFSRFLVPALCEFKGHALFMDCDWLFTRDISELLAAADWTKAVSVVKHQHQAQTGSKMGSEDPTLQLAYHRKNWSSLVLWNAGHPDNAGLSPNVVSTQTGRWLHGFAWLDDAAIGSLPAEWNWLEGYDPWPEEGPPPAGIHFTHGGPWFDDPKCQAVRFGDLWRQEKALLS